MTHQGCQDQIMHHVDQLKPPHTTAISFVDKSNKEHHGSASVRGRNRIRSYGRTPGGNGDTSVQEGGSTREQFGFLGGYTGAPAWCRAGPRGRPGHRPGTQAPVTGVIGVTAVKGVILNDESEPRAVWVFDHENAVDKIRVPDGGVALDCEVRAKISG